MLGHYQVALGLLCGRRLMVRQLVGQKKLSKLREHKCLPTVQQSTKTPKQRLQVTQLMNGHALSFPPLACKVVGGLDCSCSAYTHSLHKSD